MFDELITPRHVQVCGDEWGKHSSATGGFYACNRYVAPDQATADSLGDAGAGPGLRAFLGSMLGKIQVPVMAFTCVPLYLSISLLDDNAHPGLLL